ncbi:uncharacterized protein HMPREF1541_01430 [Cyphellophora europaea CBS 101466]|uniref:Peptidase C45 hydrolase domain-containing protein n=1 Tax=Cyphellophora europaea (strain CBS 101466) TaxID=1220924 RepID=W2SGV6_CYPE1|nr:uncharacterized protein HMPREF1541_01430 [Cyphellophora europaea CBS 101466]ETN47238.1 hypothetical protein HMPREF1541_01430 [Cyphellophora europaea CBS 101466]
MPAATTKLKHLTLSGTPKEIGQQHGTLAHAEVHGSLAFYGDFFLKKAGLQWPEVRSTAMLAHPFLESRFPHLVEEMRGLALGAGIDYEDVLALNVRTEIAYGMQTDGCTAFAWRDGEAGGNWIGQNWDWSAEQKPNLVVVRIQRQGEGKTSIAMVTEAGILGKIGLNDRGVGVTLNAIAAKGVDWGRLPCHLALRTVLDSASREEAEGTLKAFGVASSCHIQIADAATGGVGLECTSEDVAVLEQDGRGVITHSNHLVKEHKVKGSGAMLTDTFFRLERMQELLKGLQRPDMAALKEVLKDQQNGPCAINRSQTEKSTIETLFSIVVNLHERCAEVKVGKPTEDGESFELRP